MTAAELPAWVFALLHGCVIAVFVIGLLCFFARREFIRQVVGLKLMLQSVSLGFIVTGWNRGDLYLAQAMVISALIIEAIVIGLALTIIVRLSREKRRDQPLALRLFGRESDE